MMRSVGIVCEYNPFHLGHARQLEAVRRMAPEAAVVCLMSGFYVQRGQPAVFDRTVRTKAALLAGADLVLELPVTVSLRSAEGFAAGAVELLSRLGVEGLCFGAETAGREQLLDTARVLLDSRLSEALRPYLDRGLSFPAARSRAAADLGADATVLERPNDILAVEYCKAILAQGSKLTPLPIARPGDYHAREADYGPAASDSDGTAVAVLCAGGCPSGLCGGGAPQLGLGGAGGFGAAADLGAGGLCRASRRCGGTVAKVVPGVPPAKYPGGDFDGGQVQAVHPKPTGSNGFVRLPGAVGGGAVSGSAVCPNSGVPGPGQGAAPPCRWGASSGACRANQEGRLCTCGEAVPELLRSVCPGGGGTGGEAAGPGAAVRACIGADKR